MRPGLIRLIFAGTRNRKLNEHGRDRSQDQHQQRTPDATTIVAVSHAAKEETKAGQIRNRAGNRRRDRTDQDIPIINVSQFVRQHAFQLFIAQQAKDAMSDRNRSVRRITAGGESVGRFHGNHINLGHGKPDFLSDALYYAINPR